MKLLPFAAVLLALAGCHKATSSEPAPATSSEPSPDATMPTPDDPPAEGGECKPSGCSGIVCSDEDVISTCEFKPEYACYRDATCTRQPDGQCGWTQTPELEACLADPPPLE